MDGQEILTELHAIPAALSVGPAKELVGQPFCAIIASNRFSRVNAAVRFIL